MKTISARQGSRLTFQATNVPQDAVSVIFLAKYLTNAITATETPVDGIATFEIDIPESQVVGSYDYQLSVTYSSGNPDIYPNGSCSGNCTDGNCSFPKLVVCESLES